MPRLPFCARACVCCFPPSNEQRQQKRSRSTRCAAFHFRSHLLCPAAPPPGATRAAPKCSILSPPFALRRRSRGTGSDRNKVSMIPTRRQMIQTLKGKVLAVVPAASVHKTLSIGDRRWGSETSHPPSLLPPCPGRLLLLRNWSRHVGFFTSQFHFTVLSFLLPRLATRLDLVRV